MPFWDRLKPKDEKTLRLEQLSREQSCLPRAIEFITKTTVPLDLQEVRFKQIAGHERRESIILRAAILEGDQSTANGSIETDAIRGNLEYINFLRKQPNPTGRVLRQYSVQMAPTTFDRVKPVLQRKNTKVIVGGIMDDGVSHAFPVALSRNGEVVDPSLPKANQAVRLKSPFVTLYIFEKKT